MKIFASLCLFVISAFFVFPAVADVRLPRLLSDGAVLQRDKPLTIWGWADDGEKISVNFAGKSATTTAKKGEWSVTLPAFKAGGPYELKVGGNNEITRKNILIGDLWVAAGQSNMELPLNRVKYKYPQLIETTHQPEIREFNVPVAYSFKGPLQDYTQGQWKMATPENLASFSAVGFFFMQKIHVHTQVPVGLITIPAGGSPIEAWVSEAVLEKYPHYQEKLQPFKNDAHVQATINKDKANSDKWYAELNDADVGIKNNWHQEKLEFSDWKPLQVPGFFKAQGIDFTLGAVWVRKNFELTAAQANKPALLWLGAIVDGDQVYVNGHLVGQTGYQYPPRIYKLAAGVLKPGVNDLRIRITSYSGNPGFVKDKRYELLLGENPSAQDRIDLTGEWRYKIAAHVGPMQPGTTLHYLPSSLFNAKLAPALPLKVKGVLWYQGESNVDRPDAQVVKRLPGLHCTHPSCAATTSEYRYLLEDLIRDWRKQFDQGEFPFLFVQLANFLPAAEQPSESKWAQVREAQRQALQIKNTAMAVAIDVGEWNDIHPLDKQTIGERLALAAMKKAYGEKSLLASGPVLKNVKEKDGKIALGFAEVGKGLNVRGGKLKHIAVAGEDKKFVWADAAVSKNKIIVWADSVTKPKWVRYAWADNPEGANLYNSAGLPASPFEAYVK